MNELYTLNDLKSIFSKINDAVMLIQIIDGNINYIEKKGYESRNQSVIDLLIKSNNYRKLPNVQFIIYTNDILHNSEIYKNPNLLTFCKNHNYNTKLFPNFNFNHWLEANITDFETVYNYFIEKSNTSNTSNIIEWKDKKDTVFWSGANTNQIRKKIYEQTKNHKNYYINILDENKKNIIPLYDIVKYKYLLNMNGNSYAGRLNYLFLSGSCVIILKNKDKNKDFEEFFYNEFIPGMDYIEVEYSDNENPKYIIDRINNAIETNDCEKIAKQCFEKAKIIFKIENIYDYIFDLLTNLSQIYVIDNNLLENNITYLPPLNYYFKNRLQVNNNNINFNYLGDDIEINLHNSFINESVNKTLDLLENVKQNIINVKIMNDYTKISFNDNVLLSKYTPQLLTSKKSQNYKILIEKNILTLTIENKFTLIKVTLPQHDIIVKTVDVKTINGGWLFY